MARWYDRSIRPERQEVLSGWQKKSHKSKTKTLEGLQALAAPIDTPAKPGKNPKGIAHLEDKLLAPEAQQQERNRGALIPPKTKKRMGRPPKTAEEKAATKAAYEAKHPKKAKKPKDPFHERYEQHVVVTYSRKRGLPFYAIPNAARRSMWEAIEAKKSGIAPGVPDLCYPCAMGKFGGLYIEMKRRVGGVVSPMQHYWIALLRESGYRVEVAEGADQAIMVLEDYFRDYKGVSNDTLALLQIAFDHKKAAWVAKSAREPGSGKKRASVLPMPKVQKGMQDSEPVAIEAQDGECSD